MAGIKYNKEQIEELSRNPNVRKVTEKYIAFTDEFKVRAVELEKMYFLPKEIFKEFEFPEFIIQSNVPKNTLRNLKYKDRTKWIEAVVSSKKWRKKKDIVDFENMSQEEKIIHLEAENAYLKELHKMKFWHYP